MRKEQVAPARRTPALRSNPRRPAERESSLLDRYPRIYQRQGLLKEIPGVQIVARFRSLAAKAKAERVCRENIGSPIPSCCVLKGRWKIKAEMGNVYKPTETPTCSTGSSGRLWAKRPGTSQ